MGLIDGHLDASGSLMPDLDDNVHTISLQSSKNSSSIHAVAKFSRKIMVEDHTADTDLSECSVSIFI